MNQKLLKFLSKPKPSTSSTPKQKQAPKETLNLKSGRQSEKDLLSRPHSKQDIPPKPGPSHQSSAPPLILDSPKETFLDKEPVQTSITLLNKPVQAIERTLKDLDESPIKNDKITESFNNEGSLRGRNKDSLSPPKLHSRRNSKDFPTNMAISVNTANLTTNSSNTASFLSSDARLSQNSQKHKKPLKNRFTSSLGKMTQKNTGTQSMDSMIISSPIPEKKDPAKEKPNGALTEVVEKNSEIDEKTDTKRGTLKIKIDTSDLRPKFTVPETKKEDLGFAPRISSLTPKFYHHFACQRIFADKSFAQQSERNRNSLKDRNCSMKSQSLNRSLSPNKTLLFSTRRLNKAEIYDFYTKTLQSVEQVKFTVGMGTERQDSGDLALDYIINFEEVGFEEREKEVFSVVSAKFGKPFFYVLKRIFLIYASKNSEEMLILQRQLMKFAKEFELFKKIQDFSLTKLQLVFFKKAAKKQGCNLKEFIEILFKVSKIAATPNPKNQDFDLLFRRFIEDLLVPGYRRLNLLSLEFNVDSIQVFYKGQNPYENPVVNLLYETDQLLKHVFSLYETYDIQKSPFSFVHLKDFLRFAKDFAIVPYVCNCSKIVKIFMIFKDQRSEIISFMEFVVLLCCIAHIGLFFGEGVVKLGKGLGRNEKAAGFYPKMRKLIEIIMKANAKIAEKLVLSRIQNENKVQL